MDNYEELIHEWYKKFGSESVGVQQVLDELKTTVKKWELSYWLNSKKGKVVEGLKISPDKRNWKLVKVRGSYRADPKDALAFYLSIGSSLDKASGWSSVSKLEAERLIATKKFQEKLKRFKEQESFAKNNAKIANEVLKSFQKIPNEPDTENTTTFESAIKQASSILEEVNLGLNHAWAQEQERKEGEARLLKIKEEISLLEEQKEELQQEIINLKKNLPSQIYEIPKGYLRLNNKNHKTVARKLVISSEMASRLENFNTQAMENTVFYRWVLWLGMKVYERIPGWFDKQEPERSKESQKELEKLVVEFKKKFG